jgi:dipeptidyl aminopeptidase/acylaminoacyl peptidase
MPRSITAEDVFRFRLPTDARIAPDGRRLVFGVQHALPEKNRYCTNLFLLGTGATEGAEAGEPRPFTVGEHSDSSPRWSPDGASVAFVSDRDETSQIWLIPADGGEARPLTELAEGSIEALEWSPDGSRLAFSYRPKPEWARKAVREERERAKRSTPPLVVRRLAYRTEGLGYFGDERWHLFVLDARTREVTQLTHGETDQAEFAWSPDGHRIAFLTNRSPDPDRTPQLDEIRVIPAAGGEEQLIPAPAGPKSQLAWSPDGEWFAYYGNTETRDVWSATDPHLWLTPAAGGEGRDLSQALDRPVGDQTLGDLRAIGGWTGPVWSADSRSVLFLVSDRGSTHLYRAHLTGEVDCLTPEGRGGPATLSLDAHGRTLVSVVTEPLSAGDIHLAHLGLGPCRFRRLTNLNAELLGELTLAPPEEVHAPGEAGTVHGWLLRPPAPPPAGAPLILYIHGGPHLQYGWGLLHELQWLAARGFAVLYTNPRGSRGYGQEHVAAIRGDWGGADYRDLMAAVDHALTLPGIDTARVGVTGGSYGGFMTNWMIGHTDRFRCAVTQRSVVNLHSMGGTCDFNFSETEYFGGNTWENPARLLEQSPLCHLASARTPLLILHSEGDLRCPIEQAEQLFAALKNVGCEVEFVRYGREANHGLSRGGPPDLRLDRLQRIGAWFEARLAGSSD